MRGPREGDPQVGPAGILPADILDRPKMGFGVPLAQWFRTDLRHLPSELLLGLTLAFTPTSDRRRSSE